MLSRCRHGSQKFAVALGLARRLSRSSIASTVESGLKTLRSTQSGKPVKPTANQPGCAPQRKRPPVRSPTGSVGSRLLYHRLGGGYFQAGRGVTDPVESNLRLPSTTIRPCPNCPFRPIRTASDDFTDCMTQKLSSLLEVIQNASSRAFAQFLFSRFPIRQISVHETPEHLWRGLQLCD